MVRDIEVLDEQEVEEVQILPDAVAEMTEEIYLYSHACDIPLHEGLKSECFAGNRKEGLYQFKKGVPKRAPIVPQLENLGVQQNMKNRIYPHAPGKYANAAVAAYGKLGLIRLAGRRPTEEEKQRSLAAYEHYMVGLCEQYEAQVAQRKMGHAGQPAPEPHVAAFAASKGRKLGDEPFYVRTEECPQCKEINKADALRCKHCQYDLVGPEERERVLAEYQAKRSATFGQIDGPMNPVIPPTSAVARAGRPRTPSLEAPAG